jgi:hypothetical protein
MKTFIRVIEVWVPSNDRTYLEYGGGLYGKASRFGALSRSFCFGRGEGLPGQAWEQGHPIVLTAFEGSYFQRASAAKAEGLTSAVAVPIFAGDFLTSVLVLICGDDADHVGAIELWHNDPAQSPDMRLVDGYYGGTAEAFEFISRHTSFRRGTGLPGWCWESGAPVFMEDLGKSSRFLRAETATKVGINRGYAIPCPTRRNETYVLSFLSALGTPIARRFEVWIPDEEHTGLRRISGFCEVDGLLGEGRDFPALALGQGAIGKVMLSGVPALCDAAAQEPADCGKAAQRAGLQSLMAMPIIQQGRLSSVVAWYF